MVALCVTMRIKALFQVNHLNKCYYNSMLAYNYLFDKVAYQNVAKHMFIVFLHGALASTLSGVWIMHPPLT